VQNREARVARHLWAGELVIEALRGEGLEIADIRHPDEVEHTKPAPDIDLLVNNQRIANEVTEFTPDVFERPARATVARLADIIRDRFDSVVQERALGYVLLTFLYSDWKVPSRRAMESEIGPILESVARILELARPGKRIDEKFDFEEMESDSLNWFHYGHVISIPHLAPKLDILPGPGAHFVTGALFNFLGRTVTQKTRQTAGYDRSILAVLNGWVAMAEDYREALPQWAGSIPWWRIYVIGPSGATELVYEASDEGLT
jgi:hypothetical protein